MNKLTVYSIGHSNHPIEDFITLLEHHGVEVLADVRSQPYSRWVPQFNRETLAEAIEQAGLCYVWLGETLGGRPQDPSLYDDGDTRPNYERMRESGAYQAGIAQLINLIRQSTVAMMCSEGDYQHCHRTLLITPTLLDHGLRVVHILPDGRTVEATQQLEQLTLF